MLKIAGIEIRTKNKRAIFDLPAHWKAFEKVKSEIPGEGIYVVYSCYESDHMGEYNYLIGKRVEENVDTGSFKTIILEEGPYKKFTAEGAMPFALIKKWQEIWSSDLKRKYTIDYEIYNSHQLVDIYIGLK